MFWPIVTVIVAALIILAFLVPAIAAFLFGAEIAHNVHEARHEKKSRAPFCPWEPHGHASK